MSKKKKPKLYAWYVPCHEQIYEYDLRTTAALAMLILGGDESLFHNVIFLGEI